MGIFKLFLGSFHSAQAYRQMRKTASFGLGYALVLVLFTTLAVTVYFTAYLHRELLTARDGKPVLVDDVIRQIAGQIPVMTLIKNELKTKEPVKTIITISGSAFGMSFTNAPLITIDTSGSAKHDDMKTPILITNKDFIMKSTDKTEIKSISEFTKDATAPLVINRTMAEDIGEKIIAAIHEHIFGFYLIFGGMAWCIIAIYMYIARICMLLILGLAGIAIAGITKVELSYASAVSLASLSYTPVLLLDTIVFAGFLHSTHVITLFIAGVVTLFAAIKCSNPPAAPSSHVTPTV